MTSKPYVLSETARASAGGHAGPFAQSWIARWFRSVRAAAKMVEKAHDQRCTLASLPPHLQRDIGLTGEDATGISSLQPELPFFMQSGFGRC